MARQVIEGVFSELIEVKLTVLVDSYFQLAHYSIQKLAIVLPASLCLYRQIFQFFSLLIYFFEEKLNKICMFLAKLDQMHHVIIWDRLLMWRHINA